MEEYRPGSYRSYEGGRRLEVVDPASLRSVNRLYVARSRPTFDPFPCHHLASTVTVKKVSSTPKSGKGKWGWNNREMKRKKRVAMYKLYSAEGRVKASLKKGFRWVKRQCSKVIRGM